VLPSSITMLQTAAGLRAAGAIPGSTSLWAVANPVTEPDASRTEAKVEAGAEVVLTQPPLDWGAFERWWADAERRGLPGAAKILIGYPALSSAANASFWLALAGGGGSGPARRVVAAFAEAEARGRAAGAAFAEEYAEAQLRQVGRVQGWRQSRGQLGRA
jgi:5,10-methylenetetrahydrofolate reductase